MFDILKTPVVTFQEFLALAWRTLRNLPRKPHYLSDLITQADTIGFGSLPIVLLTGGFSGATMALQMSRALARYGATEQVGPFTAISLVRELGPVLSALLVAGRNASGIASELGSMKVTEQIDAMRALGTDPVQKLVKPRLLATVITLPLLTILADFIGLVGGWAVSCLLLNLTTTSQYWNTSWRILDYSDVAQGLIKPFCFAVIVAMVGCFYGIQTTGGTQGVGRSTTQAVVVASVWIFIMNFMITRFFVYL